MGWVLLGLLCSAPSLLPLLGEVPAQWVPAGASLFGLSLLPWLALAGLPCAFEAERRRPVSIWLPLAAALPGLGLGLGLDLAEGRLGLGLADGLVFLICGPSLILLWRASAVAGARSVLAARGHAVLWGFLVPLGAAAICALEWAPPPESGAGELGWLRGLNPLAWSLEHTSHGAQFGSLGSQLSWAAWLLGSAGLAWGCVVAMGRGEEA
jgi:hypothetical protein